MEIITSFSRKELEQLIESTVDKCLEKKLPPPSEPEPQEDRCSIEDACVILGTPGKPVSKATIYQLTFAKKIPFKHSGRRLVFSRRQLIDWRDSHEK